MKRSPIKRRVPLKRTSFQKRGASLNRKTPIASVTKDKVKRSKRNKLEREKMAWKQSQPQFCWVCGIRPRESRYLAVHHILRRSHTCPETFDVACNWFLVCGGPGSCHTAEFHNLPDAEVLAMKRRFDEKHYDLEAWLKMRDDRAMEYVTPGEVDAAAIRMFGSAA